jgi:hypothetical protein
MEDTSLHTPSKLTPAWISFFLTARRRSERERDKDHKEGIMERLCFLCKKVEEDDDWQGRLELERREGRALLREMVVKSDDLDWDKIISTAAELHRHQEQKIMKKERRWRKRETRKVLDKRRKADAVGSFSVNLLTMRPSKEDNSAVRRWRKRTKSASGSATSSNDESDTPTIDISSIHTPPKSDVENHVGQYIIADRITVTERPY